VELVLSFNIIWKVNILYRIFTGHVSGQEILASNLAIQGDSRFDDLRYVINDFTDITDFNITQQDISKIVAIDNAAAKSNPNIKIAIVTTLDPLQEWIKYYCQNVEDSLYECKIFGNVREAKNWATVVTN